MRNRRWLLRTGAGLTASAIAGMLGGWRWPRWWNGRRMDGTPLAATIVVSVAAALSAEPPPARSFRRDDFGIVGIFDVDWITEPRVQRLLDNMAAAPGAFTAVRFFGALNSGTRENTAPAGSGTLWPHPEAPIDFSRTMQALAALTSRGLTPFVVLSFFPAAVSPSPTLPPASFDTWKLLVRAFLDALVADPRFGAAAIREWWFEVWNEPNFAWFWDGGFARYLDLYRATSEAVAASGHRIRLGGPALAYLEAGAGPSAAAPLMEQFLRFLSTEPAVQCDFISLHGKGSWTDDAPDPRRTTAAAVETADAALRIDASRFRGMTIINNEADMKVGFDVPFEPRMTEQFPAWLAAVMIAYDDLNARFGDTGPRFLAAADAANQHLIRATFDGRRSIMTRASASARDLFKVPVFGFYEALRLLGDRHALVTRGDEAVFPHTDLFHLATAAATHIGALLCVSPRAPGLSPRTRDISYTITDIPWERANVARFQIDRTRSNGYTAAGRVLSAPFPGAAAARAIRQAQELSVTAPIQRGVTLTDGAFHDRITLDPFTVAVCWITPFMPDQPAAPAWLEASVEDGNVILRWTPNREPCFYSYEVCLMDGGRPVERLSPLPLRAALWVDTAPSGGERRYGVRAVSASGVTSAFTLAGRVTV